MNRRFAECVQIILAYEGEWSDDPRDRGGPTKYGITLRTLREWRAPAETTEVDLRNLTREEAMQIYLARHWNVLRCEDLPHGVDLAVFDFGINSGTRRAAKTFQRILGVKEDGVIGRQTIEAARAKDAESLIRDLCRARWQFVQGLVNFSAFGRGWQRRINDIEQQAIAMTRSPALTVREAMHTDTAHGAAQAVTIASPAAAAIATLVQAFSGLDWRVATVVVSAGIVITALAAWWWAVYWRRWRS